MNILKIIHYHFFFRPFRFLLKFIFGWLVRVDQKSLHSIDYFIANSNFVKKRIAQFYHISSEVIYPGIKIPSKNKTFKNDEKKPKSYFLGVGRFIPYKNFSLITQVFCKNGLPLKLVGVGPEKEKCRKIVEKYKSKNVEFLGFVEKQELETLYKNARAFLFPVEEDFGIVPLEAMSYGCPVIAYNGGGAKETVGSVSEIFSPLTEKGFTNAINSFIKNEKKFDFQKIRIQAEKFDNSTFREKIYSFVTSKINDTA